MARGLASNAEPFSRLPASSLRLLYKAFVLAGAGMQKNDLEAEFWTLVGTKWIEHNIHLFCFFQPAFGVGDFFTSSNYPECILICTSGNLNL